MCCAELTSHLIDLQAGVSAQGANQALISPHRLAEGDSGDGSLGRTERRRLIARGSFNPDSCLRTTSES